MYKKHKIVMLPSNDKQTENGICLGSTGFSKNKLYVYQHNDHWDMVQQHLYILSDDDINEGDWCYNISSQTMFKADKELIELINDPDVTLTTNKKIIATTNKSLHPVCDGHCGSECVCTIPSIPEYFIKYYIEQYNLGNVIQKVEVLYDNGNLNPDENLEIDINFETKWNKREQDYHKSQLKGEMYSREEVIQLLKDYSFEFSERPFDTDWIEQNLK